MVFRWHLFARAVCVCEQMLSVPVCVCVDIWPSVNKERSVWLVVQRQQQQQRHSKVAAHTPNTHTHTLHTHLQPSHVFSSFSFHFCSTFSLCVFSFFFLFLFSFGFFTFIWFTYVKCECRSEGATKSRAAGREEAGRQAGGRGRGLAKILNKHSMRLFARFAFALERNLARYSGESWQSVFA